MTEEAFTQHHFQLKTQNVLCMLAINLHLGAWKQTFQSGFPYISMQISKTWICEKADVMRMCIMCAVQVITNYWLGMHNTAIFDGFFLGSDVPWLADLKGIVHFEIKIWYLSAYPKGIQDVGVFFSSVDPILMFLGQTVLVCQSYNDRYISAWFKNDPMSIMCFGGKITSDHLYKKSHGQFTWFKIHYITFLHITFKY